MSSPTRLIQAALEKIDAARLNILIVEDNDVTRRLATELLRAAGFVHISLARTQEEALEVLSACSPDLILCSWGLGDACGLDLVSMVRKAAVDKAISVRHPLVPIVLMSSRRRLSQVKLARNAGINEFIIKPFSANSLLKAVTAALVKPREFIISASYIGPCRRRHKDKAYAGALRRKEDTAIIRHRQSRALFYKTLCSEMDNLRDLISAIEGLEAKSLNHFLDRIALFEKRALSLEQAAIATALNSVLSYVSDERDASEISLILLHLKSIARLCSPQNDRPEVVTSILSELTASVRKSKKRRKQAA